MDLALTKASAAIERDLHAGIIVIADRYAFSGIAFTAAKVRKGPRNSLS